LGHGEAFKAGDSFIQKFLLVGNKKSVTMHGKEMEMSLEVQKKNHASFMLLMRSTMEEYHITSEHVYNVDQTLVYFTITF
jgi:hypothetical protein